MAAGFEKVYGLVVAARLAKPVDTKALEDIRDTYGYDLYKEALDSVLAKIENYAFVMEEYVVDGDGTFSDMQLVEKDETRFVLECDGKKAIVEFDPNWSEWVYTVNGKGPFAHSSYELLRQDIMNTLAFERKSLAAKLNDFYRDFDFYDYMDSAGCFENQEEVIAELEQHLEDPDAVSGILDTLAVIKEEGGLTDEQAKILDELILDLAEVQVGLGKSVCDVIAEAIDRSEKTKIEDFIIDILQLKHGDEMHHLRFSRLDWLDNGVNSVECKNYNHVYRYSDEEPVDLGHEDAVMDLLEKIYTRFNVRHPEDFRGHSLSTSDVVILTKGKESQAFYCDWIGFKALPEKFVKDFAANEKEKHNVGKDI